LGILIFELTVGVVPFFSASKSEVFQKITGKDPVRMASWMEADCQHLVGALLQRTVADRLGTEHDVDDIKGHQWFHDVDWDMVLRKKVDPPYQPEVDESGGMEDTPDGDELLEGFTFGRTVSHHTATALLNGSLSDEVQNDGVDMDTGVKLRSNTLYQCQTAY